MSEWKLYKRTGEIEARPWTANDEALFVAGAPKDWPWSVSNPDRMLGRDGRQHGFVARNPANKLDQWYIAPDYFAKHYAEATPAALVVPPAAAKCCGGTGAPNQPCIHPEGCILYRATPAAPSGGDMGDVGELIESVYQDGLRLANQYGQQSVMAQKALRVVAALGRLETAEAERDRLRGALKDAEHHVRNEMIRWQQAGNKPMAEQAERSLRRVQGALSAPTSPPSASGGGE